MENTKKEKVAYAFQSIIIAAAFIRICVPAFNMTGQLLKPLMLCITATAAAYAVMRLLKIKPSVLGLALLITICFWFLTALCMQLKLQIDAGWVKHWIFIFYFDKLLVVGTVWLTATLLVLISRLRNPDGDYGKFFRFSGIAFIIFYSFLLVFSFVLIRLEDGSSYTINLKLFDTVKKYIADFSTVPYEVLMMVFGNLLYFTPLGYILCVALRAKKFKLKPVILFLFPLVAFSLLEYSQYLFQNGFCEIDDMLMNSLGFWLGVGLFYLSNAVTGSLTHGKLKYFWN